MPSYTQEQTQAAVSASRSYAEVLRRLGMRPAGGNHRQIRRYVDEVWKIPTDHFNPNGARVARLGRAATPLSEVLVPGSSYSRQKLKERLFATGLKPHHCELCGQGETWRGKRMALILDHINGVPDDNRLENLRIACPNCAATFETHCGRHNFAPRAEQVCGTCGTTFQPRRRGQRYCSGWCGVHHPRPNQVRLGARKVQRPPEDQLRREILETSMVAVGREYGVSDNAVRKWLRSYERERERGEVDAGAEPAG